MPSWFQNDFSGGEISPDAQGNFDDPMYGKSLALCRNSIVLPTKSVARRGGSRALCYSPATYFKLWGVSRNDSTPVLVAFAPLDQHSGGVSLYAPPSTMGATLPTFTHDVMRMPFAPVCDAYIRVTAISTDDPAKFTLASTPSPQWSVGDQVFVYIDDPDPSTASVMRARSFQVATSAVVGGQYVISLSSITADGVDPAGPAIINRTSYTGNIYLGHLLNLRGPQASAYSAYALSPIPYSGSTNVDQSYVQLTNICQTADNKVFFFVPRTMPWVLDLSDRVSPTFNDANFNWLDGPWEDPPSGDSQTGNHPLTITANAGSTITLEYDGTHTIPEIRGIGQAIRLWTQPAAWAITNPYNAGDSVTYNNEFYFASNGSVGIIPGTADSTGAFPWALDPDFGTWSNGFLVGQTATTMTFQIVSDQQVPTYSPANQIETYQVGFFFMNYVDLGDEVGQVEFTGRGPTCGAWHEGRLIVAGAQDDVVLSYPVSLGQPTQYGYNRFDASMAGGGVTVGGSIPTLSTSVPSVTVPQFSPTDNNGNVLDNSGISYTLNSDNADSIHWMVPDAQGVLLGTNTAEWLLTASALNDPLTPTSIQAHRQTRFGSSQAAPATPGLSVIFAQRAGIDVMEYVADVLSQRFTGRVLNERARHLTAGNIVIGQNWTGGGVREMAFQRQPYPILWVCTNDGILAACSYQRLSRFGQEPPVLNAWHSHRIVDYYGSPIVGQGAYTGGSAASGSPAISSPLLYLNERLTFTVTSTLSVPEGVLPDCVPNGATTTILPSQDRVFIGSALNNSSGIGARTRLDWMANPFGPTDHLTFAQQLDGGMSGGVDGIAGVQDTTGNVVTTTLYGFAESAGAFMSVYIAGRYIGDYQVQDDGSIVTTDCPDISSYADRSSFDGDMWQSSATVIAQSSSGTLTGTTWYIPVLVGAPFASQGQTLRPNSTQDAKTASGPAVAKQRRFNMMGAHVQNTVNLDLALGGEAYRAIINVGAGDPTRRQEDFVYPAFANMAPVPVVYPNGQPYKGNMDFPEISGSWFQAYNGILWAPVDDTITFDGMIAWRCQTAYPCRVLSVGGFFTVQER